MKINTLVTLLPNYRSFNIPLPLLFLIKNPDDEESIRKVEYRILK